jgi:hypothetical protein
LKYPVQTRINGITGRISKIKIISNTSRFAEKKYKSLDADNIGIINNCLEKYLHIN